jgi:hypothetical protein
MPPSKGLLVSGGSSLVNSSRNLANSEDHLRIELSKTASRLDQSISAHSELRDTYERKAFWLDLFLLLLSVVITFLAFSSREFKSSLLPTWALSDSLLSMRFLPFRHVEPIRLLCSAGIACSIGAAEGCIHGTEAGGNLGYRYCRL